MNLHLSFKSYHTALGIILLLITSINCKSNTFLQDKNLTQVIDAKSLY